MNILLGAAAIFGFCVGCLGIVDWALYYIPLSNLPAIVAGPQLIVMAVQALGGFLLMAICWHALDSSNQMTTIVSELAGFKRAGRRKTCPDCAEDVLYAARVCRHCHHEFWAEGAQPPLANKQPPMANTVPVWGGPSSWGYEPLVRPLPDEPPSENGGLRDR